MAETENTLGGDPAEVSLKMDTEPPEYAEKSGSPPTYDSMFGKMQKAKDDSSGTVDFVRRIITLIFCGTVCCSLWIFVMLALPIACIVMGVIYKDDCPREKYIPIYLIVAGCFGAVKALFTSGQRICQQVKKGRGNDDDDDDKKRPNPVDSLISCFLLAWFIAGSVWVYSIRGDYQHEHPEQDNYCHNTLYMFSFWVLTVQYILVALTLFCMCAMCVVSGCVYARSG